MCLHMAYQVFDTLSFPLYHIRTLGIAVLTNITMCIFITTTKCSFTPLTKTTDPTRIYTVSIATT